MIPQEECSRTHAHQTQCSQSENCDGFCSRSPKTSIHRPKTETNQPKLPDQGSDTALTGWQEEPRPRPRRTFCLGLVSWRMTKRNIPSLIWLTGFLPRPKLQARVLGNSAQATELGLGQIPSCVRPSPKQKTFNRSHSSCSLPSSCPLSLSNLNSKPTPPPRGQMDRR